VTRDAGRTGRVAVIGGGWSGLACAVALADAGVEVTVLEAADTLGGRARRVDHAGISLDNGQHLLLGAYAQTLAMIHKVQPDARAADLYSRIPLCIAGPGRFSLRAAPLPAPWHMFFGLLTARDCTWAERLAVARGFGDWKKAGWRAAPDMTVAQLLHGQPARISDRLWTPLCLAALNTPPASASAQVFLNVVRDGLAGARSGSDLVIPVADLSRLFPEPAAAFVTKKGGVVRTHARVRAIVADGGGVVVRSAAHGGADPAAGIANGGDRSERFAAAVIATAPWQASHLLAGIPGIDRVLTQIDAYGYEPICTIYLRFEERVELAHPMLQLAGRPGQWVFERTTAAAGESWLAVVISTDGAHRALSHEQLARDAVAELRDALQMPGLPEPSAARVIIERRATHVCTPSRVHPVAGAIAERIYIAGDHTDPDYPATLEAATRSGVRAAEAVLAARRR